MARVFNGKGGTVRVGGGPIAEITSWSLVNAVVATTVLELLRALLRWLDGRESRTVLKSELAVSKLLAVVWEKLEERG